MERKKIVYTDYIFVVFTKFEAFKLSKETYWGFFYHQSKEIVLHGVVI